MLHTLQKLDTRPCTETSDDTGSWWQPKKRTHCVRLETGNCLIRELTMVGASHNCFLIPELRQVLILLHPLWNAFPCYVTKWKWFARRQVSGKLRNMSSLWRQDFWEPILGAWRIALRCTVCPLNLFNLLKEKQKLECKEREDIPRRAGVILEDVEFWSRMKTELKLHMDVNWPSVEKTNGIREFGPFLSDSSKKKMTLVDYNYIFIWQRWPNHSLPFQFCNLLDIHLFLLSLVKMFHTKNKVGPGIMWYLENYLSYGTKNYAQ